MEVDISSTMASNSSMPNHGTATVSMDNLYPAIVQCFVIIFAGYIAGRTDIISSNQSKGIGTFVSKFCLPALMFKNMCVLDFSVVNWTFLFSILLSKTVVFFAVAILTLVSKRPVNYGYAGLFGIFATQSNDFALGYPILQALYEDSHPEYLKYIYLIAPISFIFLNPMGFILLEYQERKNIAQKIEKDDFSGEESKSLMSGKSSGSKRGFRTHKSIECLTQFLHIMKGVFLNPIVFMSVIGIAGNFLFQQKIPNVIEDILNVLGDAFTASALFFLGLSLVGKVQGSVGLGLVTPLLLIAAKSLMLPLVTWQIVGALEKPSSDMSTNSSASLSMYGFLYGTFPTAPSVFLYASQYNTASDLVATGMVAGTLLSAPIMFVSAKMMTVVVNSEMDYRSLLLEASFDTSIISFVCSVWVILLLLISRRYKKMPQQFILCLAFSHVISCLGMIIYNGGDESGSWGHYVEFSMILAGTFSVRCWTALLSLALYLLRARSLCFVLRIKFWFYLVGFGVPLFCTGMLFMFGYHHMENETDPSFHYGTDQTVLSLVMLLVCSIVNILALVLIQRNMIKSKKPISKSDKDNFQESSVLHHKPKPKVYRPSRLYSDPDPNPATLMSVDVEDSGAKGDYSSHPNQSTYTSIQGDSRGENHKGVCSSSHNVSLNAAGCDSCTGNCHSKGQKVVTDFEDIVPFPSERDGLLSSTNSSDSASCNSGDITIDVQTCTYGTCSSAQRRQCVGLIRSYNIQTATVVIDEPDVTVAQGFTRTASDPYQTSRVLLLTVAAQVSMTLGIFLCLWRLINKYTTGIYIEIEFLDTVFNYGQGFLLFAIFGFDTKFIILPCVRRWRRLIYGVETIHIPDREELNDDTVHTCDQFVKYHMKNCIRDIVRDRKYRLREYKQVFTGIEMCDWLLEVGLAHDRDEAVSYGRKLLIGQLICHVIKEHDFHDMPYFYRFINETEEEIH